MLQNGAAASISSRLIRVQLVTALVVAAPCQKQTNREIPFENSRKFGLLLVPGEVNDMPAMFIFDTGSTITAISSDLVKVAPRRGQKRFESKKGSGIVRSGMITKAKLKLGTVMCSDHEIVAMDLKDVSDAFRRCLRPHLQINSVIERG